MTATTRDIIPDCSPLHISAKGTVLLDRQMADQRKWAGLPQPGRPAVVLESGKSWFLTANDSLVRTDSQLVSGYSKPRPGREPKRWQRWKTTSMWTLRRTRYGYWLLTERVKGGGRTTTRIFGDQRHPQETSALLLFPESVRVMAGWGAELPATTGMVYPFLGHYSDKAAAEPVRQWDRQIDRTWSNLAALAGAEFSRRLAGAATARDIATVLFGATRVTKPLVKAIGNPDLPYPRLELAWAMRGLVPTDWLIDYLRSGDTPPAGTSLLRPALRIFNQTVLRRLLKAGANDLHHEELSDTIRMVRAGNHLRIPAEMLAKVRTWRDLHNVIIKGVVVSSDRWSVPQELRPLNGPVGEWMFQLLRGHASLIAVGAALNNCVGDYAHQAKSGSSVLAAVSDDEGKPVAAIELRRLHCQEGTARVWQLNQILGRFNEPLPKQMHDQLVTHLASAGSGHIVIGDAYWGRV